MSSTDPGGGKRRGAFTNEKPEANKPTPPQLTKETLKEIYGI
jgi:hypothetical protein